MSYPIHPDDVEIPRSGTWADDFNTLDEACRYYGVDTSAQIAAENAYYDQLGFIEYQDDIECRGGPKYNCFWSTYRTSDDSDWVF